MLQIRLSTVPSSEGTGGAKPLPVETVTVACPDHLIIADLPVAKSLGSATASSLVKTIGRRSRRQLGERVHFCVRCDFPIAIYGRLSPCEHAFCLDCARSDSICYLCDERIQKIQTIKMIEGIFICAAPHCLKSFLKKSDFESHIHQNHADLLRQNMDKEDGNESEAMSARRTTASDSTVQAPPRSVLSPTANSQVYDREDKTRRPQPRDQQGPRPFIQPKPGPSFSGQIQSHPPESQHDSNRPPDFDRAAPRNHFPQQSMDAQGGPQQESGQFQDKQQGISSDIPYPGYSLLPHQQPPNFAVPMNTLNPVMAPPPYGFPPFALDGTQPFYGATESEQGSLLGFPPGGMNFSGSYPRPWSVGPGGVPFEPSPMGQGSGDGFTNVFQGDYERNPGALPSNMTPVSAMESMQGQSATMDPRDGKGILAVAPQPLQLPPPPPPLHPPQISQANRGDYSSSDTSKDGPPGFSWPHEKGDNFGGGRDY